MAAAATRLQTCGIPGFRSGALWKKIVAGLGYLLIAWAFPMGFTAVGISMNQTPEQRAASLARADAKSAAVANAAADKEAKAQATAQTQAAEAAGREALQAQARSEAVDLLGQAVYKREEGQFGISIELAKQAQGKWAEFSDAKSFLAEVQPQATAAAQAAIAQATAQAVSAQATAQAVSAQATARAQATQQAAQSRQAAIQTYKTRIGTAAGAYAEGLKVYGAQARQAGVAPALVLNADWKLKMFSAMVTIQWAADEMAGIAPVPPEFVRAANLAKQIQSETKLMNNDMGRGIDNVDARAVGSANTRMAKMADISDQLVAELRKA